MFCISLTWISPKTFLYFQIFSSQYFTHISLKFLSIHVLYFFIQAKFIHFSIRYHPQSNYPTRYPTLLASWHPSLNVNLGHRCTHLQSRRLAWHRVGQLPLPWQASSWSLQLTCRSRSLERILSRNLEGCTCHRPHLQLCHRLPD